jgi:hypothetical protein
LVYKFERISSFMAKTIGKGNNLWKCVMALFTVFIVLTSFKQDDNEKIWDAKSPLKWSDYRRPDKDKRLDARASALTVIAIPYRYKRLKSDSNVYVLAFQVKNVMYRNQSWVQPGYTSTALLVHEQLHFDLSEYFSRQLLKALEGFTYSKNFKNEMLEIVKRNDAQYKSMGNLYDEQSIHSTNTVMQSKWNDYVQSLLLSNESIENALKRLPKLVQ